ncbi:MAG TPA: DUF6600 domain-containing protein, partial [Polyangia bacterium]
MKTVAALSLFSLVPAIAFTLASSNAGAQQLQPPIPPPRAPQEQRQAQSPDGAQPVDPAQVVDPSQLPEPYRPPVYPNQPNQANDPSQPFDPNQVAADPTQEPAQQGQIDWPQDLAPEEAEVDSYDDGYDPQAYAEFQDELAPYGDWVDDASYGRVWVPEASLVGADFTPYYSGGRWLLTEYGWTWVSDWSWGWAPFHYGRWIVSGAHWCWVPGRNWGPAWVSWRSGGGWVGWAALPPRGVSVTMTYGARSPWRFSRLADLGAPRPRVVPARDMRGMFHRTTLVANDRVLTRGGTTVHINAGPRYVPNASPARLMAVAPQAFPQRRILPQRGVNFAERPWIRAATGGGAPTPAGVPAVHSGANVGVRTLGRATPTHAAAPTPPPRIYNPPRAYASTLAPHGYGQPATYGASRALGAAPGSNAPRVYNPVRTYGAAPGSNAPHAYNPPPRAPQQPRMYGPPPSGNLPRVYSPPPRTFAQPPAQRAPMQSYRPAYTPPPSYSAPHNFSAPAPSFGGGGFGHAGGGFGHAGGGFGQPGGGGGGMHFGGGH